MSKNGTSSLRPAAPRTVSVSLNAEDRALLEKYAATQQLYPGERPRWGTLCGRLIGAALRLEAKS